MNGLEKVAISDALPLKAARRDAIAKLKCFSRLRIWAADKSNAVSFRFAVGRHVNAAYSVCEGLGIQQHTEGR